MACTMEQLSKSTVPTWECIRANSTHMQAGLHESFDLILSPKRSQLIALLYAATSMKVSLYAKP